MDAYYGLASPPRHVPWPVRGQVLFGGFANQFGWLFFGFGLIFIWFFGSMADLSSIYFSLGQVETIAGVVSEVEETSATESDIRVYASHYTFRVEQLEQEFPGVSYTTGPRFSSGDQVTVEYLAQNPEISRIQGARANLFSPWVVCLVGIFPSVGLGFLAVGVRQGIKGYRLLTNGRVGLGRLISKEPTNMRVNRKTVYKLTFEFKSDEGLTYQAVAKTHLTHLLLDEAQEQLLYDPANPTYAVMLDDLPGAPDIDELGRIQAANLGRSMLPLILPVLVLGIHGIIFLFVIL